MKSRWIGMGLVLILALPLAVVGAQDPDVTPPPASYDEVADQVAEIATMAEPAGVEVADLFISGEIEVIYNRMAADFQAMVTLEELQAGYEQLVTMSAVGERLDFRVVAFGGMPVFAAVYEWGPGQLMLTVGFDEFGDIALFSISIVSSLDPDPSTDYENKAVYRLPFDGLWYTFWGGPDELHNYHVVFRSQRHAIDFVIWRDGSTFTGDGTHVEDYYVYGQPILAPAAGEVIAVVNDLPNVEPQVGSDTVNLAGNHVMLKVAEGEYLLIAHMMPGSIVVEVGDQVAAGQLIGQVGNSGNTSEPHIHIHLQDQPDLYVFDDAGQIIGLNGDATGLPLPFAQYLGNGELVESGEPLGGTFVQNAP